MKKTIPEYYRFTIIFSQRGGGYGELGSSVKAEDLRSALEKLAKENPYEVAHCVSAYHVDKYGHETRLDYIKVRSYAK